MTKNDRSGRYFKSYLEDNLRICNGSARYWSDLRSTLKLKDEVQFYSLRDSGIIQMLRDGRSPKEVMEAADHSSIEMTNNYVKVARKESNRDIINKSSAF